MALLQTAANIAQVHNAFAARRQNELSHAQLHQLGHLNNQLWLQQQSAAFQADISQALFETERVANRVRGTMGPDPFAAAVVSHYWLLRIGGIQPHSFAHIEQKRAWADATQILHHAIERSRSDGACQASVTAYIGQLDAWNHLRMPFGDHPDAYLAAAGHHAHAGNAAAARKLLLARIVLGIAGSVVLFFFLMLALSGVAAAMVLIFLCLPIGALCVAALLAWSAARRNAEVAAAGAQHAHGAVTAFQQFMSAPTGGVALERAWHEHPLLFREPAPEAPSATGHGQSVQTYVERQVVERQVIVARCKFCKQLTPADADGCRSCGAPAFA